MIMFQPCPREFFRR